MTVPTSRLSLPRQLARTRRFTLGEPSQFVVSAGGERVLFLRSRGGEDPATCLWLLDVEAGAERLLADPTRLLADAEEQLTPAERTRRERVREQRSGIVGFATDAPARLAAFTLSDRLWAVDVQTGETRALVSGREVLDPRPDPTGSRVAYVSDGALRIVEGDGSADRALAEPDGAVVQFGVCEHVATESMGRDRGYWWAPDGSALLVARVDESVVNVWHIADPSHPDRRPRAVRYPSAGTTNAVVSLWVVALDGSRRQVDWDTTSFEYLNSAGWDDHGPYAAVQARDQQTVRMLAIEPSSGGTATLLEQHDRAWVQLIPGLPTRTASGAIVSHLDRAGTRFLAIDRQPVTPPGLNLREVLEADGDHVLFTASDDPLTTDLWLLHPDGELRQLSKESGSHSGLRRDRTLLHVAETADARRVTVQRDGREPVEVRSYAAEPVLTSRGRLLRLGQRKLAAELFLPSWHQRGTTLPVLLDPYAGPAAQKVLFGSRPMTLTSQWFAEQGFAVLVIDGRGTPGRGPDWEREVYGDIFGPALQDQVDGLTAAADLHPELDLARVAIRGWSYSGSLAVAAVLRRPDVFHAAVAGAGVTDQRLYDTHWRERFLGHPTEHPDWYDRCNLVLEANELTRPLLLIHGLGDDNVFPASSLQLSTALLAAGKPHEVLLLSDATHMTSGEALAENLLLHQLHFLRHSLGLPSGLATDRGR